MKDEKFGSLTKEKTQCYYNSLSIVHCKEIKSAASNYQLILLNKNFSINFFKIAWCLGYMSSKINPDVYNL